MLRTLYKQMFEVGLPQAQQTPHLNFSKKLLDVNEDAMLHNVRLGGTDWQGPATCR